MTSMKNGHWERIFDVTRLYQDQFKSLLRWLEGEGLTVSHNVTADEKLGIFMAIIAKNEDYRMLRELFQRSLRTIQRAFHEVLHLIRKRLYCEVVKPVDNSIPSVIKDSRARSPFFDACRGAVDGTHIPISIGLRAVKRHQKKPVPAAWRNRKGYYSQNVFACVDFDGNFRFVLAGWEGSAHDSRVIRSAISHGFKAPGPRTYYLADAGYSSMDGLLIVPYPKTRYHLKEWDLQGRNPENMKELFNLRHSSLRTVVERAFGVLKWRFTILRAGRRGFSIRTQVNIVYACVALHNWLNIYGGDFEGMERQATEEDLVGSIAEDTGDEALPDGLITDDELRDEIAEFMWECYVEWKQGVSIL
jgi:hypothetical protein